jgi:peroxiredoxin
MAKTENLYDLPEGIPAPTDDGAADHLHGMRLPSVPLTSTSGDTVDLSSLSGVTVVYGYPMTGRPDTELPRGWDEIPGARGCTPQSCSFRDHYSELRDLGARVFGLSTQSAGYQQEAVGRLQLPFELLSDERLAFAAALGLPTFEVDGTTLLKRLTLIIEDGRIEKVFYPVFPPGKNAEEVLAWLRQAREDRDG